ncbi:LPS export ABC transporter periplasmic protein LptC [Psittacicella melopsittaci]|uniref:LPS export ABC transporter periplasmic protein LptC n=1 Tax=Psittacicella melopsittaci TaxID=2028576 RepID=A0A3A1Y2L2_9GAMM|nr:LPS export ABC transporter periplasmic protein LptC [Psittacicella melopsittaci]
MIIQKRLIFVFVLLAISIGFYSLYTNDDETTGADAPVALPQMELTNAVMSNFDPLGNSQYVVISSTVTKGQDNTFNFNNVLAYSLNQENLDNSVFMRTSTAYLENKIIRFNNPVQIFTINDSRFERANLSNAEFNLNTNILSSNSPITIFGQSYTTKAAGFRFFLKENRYTLEGDVETNYGF